MTIFDLVFMAATLALVVTLALSAFAAGRGQHRHALVLLVRAAIATVAYFAVLIVVSLRAPRRVVPVGTPQCFDDWCITAVSAFRQRPFASGSLRVVVRLSSTALRVTQRERGVRIYVIDDTISNTRYDPQPEAGVTPLDVALGPGDSATTSRLFIVPATALRPLLVVEHGAFPGCCIIGDAGSLFHKRTVMALQ